MPDGSGDNLLNLAYLRTRCHQLILMEGCEQFGLFVTQGNVFGCLVELERTSTLLCDVFSNSIALMLSLTQSHYPTLK